MLGEYFPGTFTQWVADNVDHNVASIDGNNSLHGVGIIAISTPERDIPLVAKSRLIHRQQHIKRAKKLVAKINKSVKATEMLKKLSGIKLLGDCSTRWSSTFLLLERLLRV